MRFSKACALAVLVAVETGPRVAAAQAPSATAPAAEKAAPQEVPSAPASEPSPVVKPGSAAASAPMQSEIAPKAGTPDTRARAVRAYERALAAKKLGVSEPLTIDRLREDLAAAEVELSDGRRDEAIADLVYLIESSRFEPFAKFDEGKALVFLLGDALGRAGAYDPARAYLLRLVEGDPTHTHYRRAVHSLVDFGLESGEPNVFLEDLRRVPPSAPEELRADIAYLAGRASQKAGDSQKALESFARVTPRSRFWAQATYLSGLIEVKRKRLPQAEKLFCKVADAKQTPPQAVVYGGGDFFRVRDMSRLALGRVAHEQYRFADSRYYYYLVPQDSEVLPEALYEAATGRYEAKDYRGARDLVDELRNLEQNHPYEDEVWIFDAYVDLATCEFARADLKLAEFLKRYEPVRDAARRLSRDEAALDRLLSAVNSGADPATANLGVRSDVAHALGTLLRVDGAYGGVEHRLSQLDHEMSGLRRTMAELDDVRQKLVSPEAVRARSEAPMAGSEAEQLARIQSELSEVRRLIRDVERSGGDKTALGDLNRALEALEVRARAARTASEAAPSAEKKGETLEALVAADRERASALYVQAKQAREGLLADQHKLSKDGLSRLDQRLSRLLRRARLGRIETVLGKKRTLELEIEALTQGYLPLGAVDSLEAARYLRADEEYWPFEGEDWADEYVGGEGLE